ncbi:MAG: PGPGW domain-containing protein [Acidobacteriota bacterium]
MISREVRRRIWRVVRITAGSILLVLGVVGLVLPFLQGIALILAGLAVLATELPWARRWLHALRDRLRRLRRRRKGETPDEERAA